MELLHSKQELLGLSCRERAPHLKSRGHEEMCVSGPRWLAVTWSHGVETLVVKMKMHLEPGRVCLIN